MESTPVLRGGDDCGSRLVCFSKIGLGMEEIVVTVGEMVGVVKEKLSYRLGLAPDEMRWVYCGTLMEDDLTLLSYGVSNGSVINVVARLRGGMQIFAKTMDGKTVPFEVTNNETIATMERKIQEKLGLNPDEQKLMFQGLILEDEKTLEEYQITDKSVINVVMRLRGGMQIFAKTMDGKTVPFAIMKNETIGAMKKKIQEKIGLAPEEQYLIFRDEILEDDKTVEEYQIVDKSVIIVVARLR